VPLRLRGARQTPPSLQHREGPIGRAFSVRHVSEPRTSTTAGRAACTSLASDRPPRSTRPPAGRRRASTFPACFAQCPRSAKHREGHRRLRNALLQCAGGVRARLSSGRPSEDPKRSTIRRQSHRVSSSHRRSLGLAVHGSAASLVLPNPPRLHSATPNPGMQRTRFARR